MSPLPDATQKVAIVTGASQGIGAGLADGVPRLGYAVVATSRSIAALRRSRLSSPCRATSPRPTPPSAWSTQALDRFGRIDSLINNAGIFIGKPFTDYTARGLRRDHGVNLAGFFHITQRAIRQMVDPGQRPHRQRLDHASSTSADSSNPAALAILTKGGLVAVTRSLAIEYASRGVRVNAVSLGVIKTPQSRRELL